jgi:CDP-glucose 4,6-dehydratase
VQPQPIHDARQEFWRNRAVLVTDAGGFLAACLSQALVEVGARVVSLLSGSTAHPRAGDRSLPGQALIHANSANPGQLGALLREYAIDTCFHLADEERAAGDTPAGIDSIIQEACRSSRTVSRVVVGVGHNWPPSTAVCYDGPSDVAVVIGRCSSIYGGGDLRWPRLVPGTMRSILHGEDVVIRSDGSPQRDYLYVTDAVSGFMSLAELAAEVRGHTFEFGYGHATSVLSLVETALAQAGSPARPRILGEEPADESWPRLDSANAHSQLGWKPAVDLPQGLARCLTWYAHFFGGVSSRQVTHSTPRDIPTPKGASSKPPLLGNLFRRERSFAWTAGERLVGPDRI